MPGQSFLGGTPSSPFSAESGDKFQKELEINSLFETLKCISLEEKLWSHKDWLVQSKS